MQVHKFGGSSIGNQKGFEQIYSIVSQTNQQAVVVVSACGKTTDNLLELASLAINQDLTYKDKIKQILAYHVELIKNQLAPQNAAASISFVQAKLNEVELIIESIYYLKEFSPRSYDILVSYGEIISSTLLFHYFKEQNCDAIWVDSREYMKTDCTFSNAKVNFIETEKNLQSLFSNKHKVYIMGGFIASSFPDNIPTTLGRGGSDYTASIIASIAKVNDLFIWTDVNGMMTADPRLVPNAISLPELSYGEAMELCHFGAKVIYPPTIIPAMKSQIPIQVKSTFEPEKNGTIIKKDVVDKKIVSGLTAIPQVCAITLEGSGMVGIPGFTSRFLGIVAANGINVVMVTQASSEHGMTMVIMPEDKAKAIEALTYELRYELAESIIEPIKVEENLSIVAIVGHNMKNYHGIAGRTFSVLGKNGVNIRALAQGSSENNITMVVADSHMKKALVVLHEEFFEEQIKQVNLFIVGVGTVGSKLIEQIKQQQKYLVEQNSLKINIVGIANSKKMHFNAAGIDLNTPYQDLFQEAETMNIDNFVQNAIKLNLGNSIFIDNTANENIAACYENCLQNGIGVVTCNKIASSAKYDRYQNLKKLSKKHNAPYLFETNVGAALPIILTINDLVKSGDTVTGIKAVLSGSLTFIMNNFVEGTRFVDIVKKAMEMGYTEPDPRIDLSFLDVKRKLLILLRESGYTLEMDEIQAKEFIPNEYFNAASVDEFLSLLEQNDAYFQKLRKEAESTQKKLKIVASYENKIPSVGLEMVDSQSPYYQLDGSDNIVLFYTDRYTTQPMIIKGAGAGAEVTASGVFADIMRAVN